MFYAFHYLDLSQDCFSLVLSYQLEFPYYFYYEVLTVLLPGAHFDLCVGALADKLSHKIIASFRRGKSDGGQFDKSNIFLLLGGIEGGVGKLGEGFSKLIVMHDSSDINKLQYNRTLFYEFYLPENPLGV